jgi:hypothetical protein
LLDRQVDFLLRQTDSAAFLIQVEPFLTALRTEPRLAAYADDLLDEVVGIIDEMEAVDSELTSELLELRRELVELWPDADDSQVEPSSESDSRATRLQARLSYRGTLAYFDAWAAGEPEPFNADGEGGLAKTLLGILQNKATAYSLQVEAAGDRGCTSESNLDDAPTEPRLPTAGHQSGPAPDHLDAWRRRLGNVQRRYDYAVRLLRLRTRTSAGLALVNLEAVPDQLNPPARLLDDERQETLNAASDLIKWVTSESYPSSNWLGRRGSTLATSRSSTSASPTYAMPSNGSEKTYTVVSAQPARDWHWLIGSSCAASGMTANECWLWQTTSDCRADPKTASRASSPAISSTLDSLR